MITDESMRHFYLYAKYWYAKGDMIEDLKKIMAHRCNVEPSSVSIGDLQHILLKEAEHLGASLLTFVTSVRDEIKFWPNFLRTQAPDLDRVILEKALVELTLAKLEYTELGSPDPAVLPVAIHKVPK